jgi:ferredoxin
MHHDGTGLLCCTDASRDFLEIPGPNKIKKQVAIESSHRRYCTSRLGCCWCSRAIRNGQRNTSRHGRIEMESNRKFRPTQKRLTCTARIYKKKRNKRAAVYSRDAAGRVVILQLLLYILLYNRSIYNVVFFVRVGGGETLSRSALWCRHM